jgi:UDP-GlcNAc:undecaprenyl-phosphate/decaprenyl-phosphate GlcNAc-1-phosphate transferase
MILTSSVVLGFGVAFLTTLVATPIARLAALHLQILDRPKAGKVHRVAVPYLGGLAILGGFSTSVLVTGAWRELGGVTAAIGLLTLVGLFDDVKTASASLRFLVHTLAAAIAVVTGIVATPTNVDVLNVAITVVWLVGITNAFNLLDNMNGLSAGIAAIAAASFFLMAATEGQLVISVLAVAVCGAALGFMPHNFPRARIFMGDAGSVPLGFLLAIIALKVRFPVPEPWSFAAPVCVLWVAVVDTTVVVVDRLRSGRPVAIGGTDHLSHRIVRRGVSPTGAVALLLALSSTVGLVGLLGGRGLLPPAAMVLVWLVLAAGGVFLLLEEHSSRSMGASWTKALVDR